MRLVARWLMFLVSVVPLDKDSLCAGSCAGAYTDGFYMGRDSAGTEMCFCGDPRPMPKLTQRFQLPSRMNKNSHSHVYYGVDEPHIASPDPDPPYAPPTADLPF